MFAAGVGLSEVRELEATVRRQVDRLQPGDVPLSDAPALWQAYDIVERLVSSAKTLLAGCVEESQVWAREGDRSVADYLARTSGCSRGEARLRLETSKRLPKLPHTEAALRRGELSRPQAEAIAAAATVNPRAERSLLEMAKRASLSELRDECGRAKATADPDPEATIGGSTTIGGCAPTPTQREHGACMCAAHPMRGRSSTERWSR